LTIQTLDFDDIRNAVCELK